MKNKAQKNGYKHTLQKRFLTLLLVSIILASGMIGGAGIASAQRVINEDSSQIMNLLCEQKASEINLMLKEIASSVDMDYSYVSRRLSQDRSMWNDTEYMEDYMQHVHDELDNTARNTSAAVSIYMRLNPDIFRTTQGVFLVKNAIGKFTERAPTDIQAYDPTDREHVGWYYETIEQGQAIWMEPYYNQNTRVYMTSYVIPIYRDDTLIGVIGMDISMEKLQDSVKNLSAYDTGYAFLVSDDGDLVYHKDYENGITVDQFDDNLTQVHDILDTERIEGKIYSYTWKGASKRLVYKKLTNNMYLVLCAPASEIDVSRNSLAMQCLVILFVVLLIASIAGIHMVHRITKPLRGLTEAAKQVAGGDWNAKIEAGGQDEVGVLATTLQNTLEQLRHNVEVANYMADRDTLTGLYNRYYMTQFCGKHMMEGEKEAGVLYCDLNGLKYMNDHYGHARGDQMIMEAADQIRQCFPIDMCCRMGGDEFVVCVFGRSEKDFRKQVEELRSKMCLGQLASASIGWCWCEEIEDFDAMMTEAENAMYQEKQKFYEQHPKQKR